MRNFYAVIVCVCAIGACPALAGDNGFTTFDKYQHTPNAAPVKVEAGTAGGATAPQPANVVGLVQIHQAADRIRHFHARDEFDGLPNLAIAGRAFSVDLPIRSLFTACPGSAYYSYDPSSQKLTVRYADTTLVSEYFAVGHGGPSPDYHAMPRVFSLSCVSGSGRPYVGSNAFGVSAVVSVDTERFDALADQTSQGYAMSTSWETTMEPDAARALVKGAHLRVQGTVGEWGHNAPVYCGMNYMGATISDPSELTQDGCFIAVNITGIDLIDAAGKEIAVLK